MGNELKSNTDTNFYIDLHKETQKQKYAERDDKDYTVLKSLVSQCKKMYLVQHDTFEDTNVLFTRKQDADDYLEYLQNQKEEKNKWSIVVLYEGFQFDAKIHYQIDIFTK